MDMILAYYSYLGIAVNTRHNLQNTHSLVMILSLKNAFLLDICKPIHGKKKSKKNNAPGDIFM